MGPSDNETEEQPAGGTRAFKNKPAPRERPSSLLNAAALQNGDGLSRACRQRGGEAGDGRLLAKFSIDFSAPWCVRPDTSVANGLLKIR